MKTTRQARLLLVVITSAVSTVALLASGGPPQLNDPSTADVFTGASALIDGIENLCYLGGAICAVIGAVVTYTDFIDGEENFYVGVRNWFGCCIALIVFPFLVRSLAGV